MKLNNICRLPKVFAMIGVSILLGCGKSDDSSPVREGIRTNSLAPTTTTNGLNEVPAIASKVRDFRQKKDPEKAHQAMRALTNNWSPVGKNLTELQRLLGAPDEKTPGLWSYRFDSGWTGWIWVFQLSGQTITNSHVVGID